MDLRDWVAQKKGSEGRGKKVRKNHRPLTGNVPGGYESRKGNGAEEKC